MKNYVIGTLVVIILVLSSIIYKKEASHTDRFPVLERKKRCDAEVPLLLYVFFSKRNCHDCLEFIEALNDLPSQFIVIGIVPQNELKNEKELREITGAAFPLFSSNEYKKYVPWYTPSIIGVSPTNREIVFTLPGVPGQKEYLANFLDSLYNKLYPIFLKEKEKNE